MNRRKTARTYLALLLGAGVLLLAACGGSGGGGGGSPDAAEIADGQKLFQSTCASCHGQGGEGMPKLGKDLRANEFVASLNDEELAAFFMEGRPAFHPDNERKVDMPPRGGNPTLNGDDMRLIAVYVRSIQ